MTRRRPRALAAAAHLLNRRDEAAGGRLVKYTGNTPISSAGLRVVLRRREAPDG